MRLSPVPNRRPRRLPRRAGLAASALALVASCTAAGAAGLPGPHADTTAVPGPLVTPGSATGTQPADGGAPPPEGMDPAPVLPDLRAFAARAPGNPSAVSVPLPSATGSVRGIPVTVLDAYRHAVQVLDASEPGCQIPLALLAGIGKVESGQAEGGRVDAHGNALRPILGPVLDGASGTAAIADTDNGALDGSATWDRAVGPMQFIPSTWRNWASDGNDDGVTNPENVYDASLGAARYLCANHRDLATQAGLTSAILSYNYSPAYLALVESWMRTYGSSAVPTPDTPGTPFPVIPAPAMAAMAPSAGPPAPTAPGSIVLADGVPAASASAATRPGNTDSAAAGTTSSGPGSAGDDLAAPAVVAVASTAVPAVPVRGASTPRVVGAAVSTTPDPIGQHVVSAAPGTAVVVVSPPVVTPVVTGVAATRHSDIPAIPPAASSTPLAPAASRSTALVPSTPDPAAIRCAVATEVADALAGSPTVAAQTADPTAECPATCTTPAPPTPHQPSTPAVCPVTAAEPAAP